MTAQPDVVRTGTIANTVFQVSLFKDQKDRRPKGGEALWSTVVEKLTTPRGVRSPDQRPAWSPATYKPRGTRGNENVLSLSMLALDLDDDTTVADALDLFDGYARLAHTSWSHQRPKHDVTCNRCRLVVPFADACPPDRWPAVLRGAFHLVKQAGIQPDEKCNDLARIYFLPCKQDDEQPFEAEARDGALLDWRDLELAAPAAPVSPPRPAPPPPRDRPQDGTSDAERVRRYAQTMADRIALMPEDSGRNDATYQAGNALGRRLEHYGLADDLADVLVEGAIRANLDVGEAATAALRGVRDGRAHPEPLEDRPYEQQGPRAVRWKGGTLRVPTRSGDPEQPAPALPLLVVHGPGWWVWDRHKRYLPVPKAIAPVEVQRIHAVSCQIPSERGEARWMNQAELHDAHGVAAQTIAWSCAVEDPSWDPVLRELVVPAGRFRTGRAERSERCEKWLEAMTGAAVDRVLDWSAVLDRQDEPCAALTLIGPPGVGKGMFASAVTTLFGGFVSYAEAMSRFNAGLAQHPFVWLDERTTFRGGSDVFRSLMGNRIHRIEAKYQMHQELRGCIRLLATSNHDDPYRLGADDLGIADEDAIGARLILVRCLENGREHLDEIGGAEATAGWCEPDGELVCHLRWLVESRVVVPGKRFIVEGDSTAYATQIGTQTGLPGSILDAIARHRDDGQVRKRVESCCPFLFNEDNYPNSVIVSSSRLLDTWTLLVGGNRTPSNVEMGLALKKLARRGNERLMLKNGDRPRGYVVPLDLLGGR